MRTAKGYQIVYNLSIAAGLDIVLPSAFICETDDGNQPGYMRAVALKETLESYHIDISGTAHETLLHLCGELTIQSIEANFNKNQKKKKNLQSLFADVTVRKLVQVSIDRRMVAFLQIIRDQNYAICFDLQRKIKARDVQLHFFPANAKPHLLFVKTQTGIKYSLTLSIDHKMIRPKTHDITIISDMPATLIIDHHIVWLEHLNAAKLKPFFIHESIFVPEKLTKDYFRQFITDVMGKVDIEVEGFDLIKVDNISRKILRFVYDIFARKWVIDLVFEYGESRFSYSDVGKRKTRILFESDQISVYQSTRNVADEKTSVDVLLDAQCIQTDAKKFAHGEGEFDVLHFVADRYQMFSSFFTVEAPEIDGRTLAFATMTVDRQFVLVGDWFDLYGRIMIGEDSYPIKMLFENIKKNDPLFIMKDGRVFIIPEEILAQYEQLVRFSKSDQDEWKLSKQHFTLIDSSIGMPEAATHILYSDDDIVYTGSNKLKAHLRTYQVQGVKWLIKHRRNGMGACLADDMGLGKTLQTLAALLDAKENDVVHELSNGLPVQLDLFGEQHVHCRKSLCALIVLPASLIFNWREEIKKFVPSFMVLNYTGPSRKNAESTIATFDIILTTYQTAVMDIDILNAIHFNYIVLDESQQIRNKNSKIFKSLNQLQTNFKISLSGTPIENSLADLWSQMEFINPQILGTYPFFKETFQLPIEKLRDTQTIQQLKTLVDPFILRRTKEQVAPDLPELTEIIHYSDMTADQAKVYEKERSAARNFLLGLNQTSGEYRFHVLASLTKLRQIANHPRLGIGDYGGESGKFDDVTSQISTIVRSGHKVLVFSSFKAHLDLLAVWMKASDIPFVLLTGDLNSDQRQASVHSFQNDAGIQVFLISIKAGGTGLNLTAADYVFILDPWWNPFVEKQAVARAHRIGQKNKVIVTRFISIASIEEKILVLQQRKKLLSDDIIDMSVLPDLNADDLELLLS